MSTETTPPAPGDKTTPPKVTGSEAQQSDWGQKTQKFIWDVLKFIWELIKTFFLTLRALLFLIIKTPYMLVPSSAHTSLEDDRYNKQLSSTLSGIVDDLEGLSQPERKVITENWIGQIKWTENRATRERDANELIRWWQIILGVLIPVLANIDIANRELLISAAGIFVAILTAIAQFRRPEERWRHYRLINERYLSELWQFVALSGVYQEFRDDETRRHKAAFPVFDACMTAIRTEDLTKFFNEVVPPRQRPQAEEEEGTPPGTGGEVP